MRHLAGSAEILRGLKCFKRIAKQDLLASSHTDDPAYWRMQAEHRRAAYDRLAHEVEQHGVEATCRWAMDAYRALPLSQPGRRDPETEGIEQALELFFHIAGVEQATCTRAYNARRRARRPAQRSAVLRLMNRPKTASTTGVVRSD